MKRTFLFATIAALAAGNALAQSSVTIYGRVNVSAESQDTSGAQTEQLVNNSSRIGLVGREDLGGGLKAGFQLEHGFSIDTGLSASRFWGRQSEVNLSGGFGMVRLGNFTSEAYYASADYVSMHNHDTGTSSDALYAYLGRNINKIAYRLPEFVKNMTLEGGMSLAEGAAGASRSYDLAWNYSIGALALGAGYEKNGDAQQYAVRGLYEMGNFVFGGYVQRDEDGWAANAGTRTSYRAAVMYKIGAGELHANYGGSGEYSNIAGSDADQFTFGYNYNLSKRTKVYAFYTKVGDSTATYGMGGDFTSVALGMRHNF